jgi:hypothetical protein
MKMDANETKIFVITHKKYRMPDSKIYYPIQVGCEGKKSLNYLKDNVGENISSRNFTFCELTGMYWIWKNVNCKTVGLVHYRRFFYPNRFIFNYNKYLKENEILRLLKKGSIIIPEKGYTFPKTDFEEYEYVHDKNELLKCREIISTKYPDYLIAFDKVINKKYYSQYNMIITSKEIFDKYCEWLFDILIEADKSFNYEDKSDYDKRTCGFLGERLMNVWLYKNKQYKIIERPVYNCEKNLFLQELQYFIKKIMDLFLKK